MSARLVNCAGVHPANAHICEDGHARFPLPVRLTKSTRPGLSGCASHILRRGVRVWLTALARAEESKVNQESSPLPGSGLEKNGASRGLRVFSFGFKEQGPPHSGQTLATSLVLEFHRHESKMAAEGRRPPGLAVRRTLPASPGR
jgi:hypothetical protein